MPNYQLSKIYKIYSPSKNLIYYGSTTQTLSQRFNEHISRHKKYNIDNNYCAYVSSFLILDCEDYKIELVEEYACNNKQQLLKKEAEYIKNNECINKEVPLRTKREWKIDNADIIKEKDKQYYLNNADKIKQYNRQYHINNRAKINEYYKQYRLKKKAEQEI